MRQSNRSTVVKAAVISRDCGASFHRSATRAAFGGIAYPAPFQPFGRLHAVRVWQFWLARSRWFGEHRKLRIQRWEGGSDWELGCGPWRLQPLPVFCERAWSVNDWICRRVVVNCCGRGARAWRVGLNWVNAEVLRGGGVWRKVGRALVPWRDSACHELTN